MGGVSGWPDALALGELRLGSILIQLEPRGLDWALGAPQGQRQDSIPVSLPPCIRYQGMGWDGARVASVPGESSPHFNPSSALWPCFLPVPPRWAEESVLADYLQGKFLWAWTERPQIPGGELEGSFPVRSQGLPGGLCET